MKKIDIKNYDSDKAGYMPKYQEYFAELQNKPITLLELGIFRGGSMLLWRDFFEKGTIVGLDLELPEGPKDLDRISMYKGDQTDQNLLDKIGKKHAPAGFDIIIDDASHFGKETFESFVYLFKNNLKSGGIYVIEDWGTGYWPHYPDGRNLELNQHHASFHLHKNSNGKFKPKGFVRKGAVLNKHRFKSHDFGMVGFVKQLVDEVAISGVTHPEYSATKENLHSFVSKLMIHDGQVFVYKS